MFAALLRILRAVRWWVTNLMGDCDYARYVAHMRRNHPEAPLQSEKEFWRHRHAAAEANPGARCC